MNTDKACVQDILDAMHAVVGYVGNRRFDEFLADELVIDAVERPLEIMGEATKRLSLALREAHPDIPWRRMAGMRDLLIHSYDDIELEVVYDAVTAVIPPLIPAIQSILELLPAPE